MDRWRRYVCLVANKNCTGTYPLRRIDASSLFYPKNNQVRLADTPPEEHPLPLPYISFSPSRSSFGKGILDFFGLFGVGEKKTLLAAVDYRGVSLMYDVDDRVITDIATPQVAKRGEPVSVALGDALYVMDGKLIPGRHGGCFDALTLGPSKDLLCTRLQWDWRTLQPPPFMLEPGYKTTRICAYTAVGGSSILISMPNIGTYSFDTVSSSWNKAGDWELPFHRRADFVPEHGVWLGFSAQDGRLCFSSDLGASMQRQPALDVLWDDDPTVKMISCDDLQWPQKYTRILKSDLVHLGSGEFCVARMFERVENVLTEHGCIPQVEAFVVLTGLELKPGECGRGIEMIPHKSLLYRSEGMAYCWVF
ncbi:unnamed protein product [Urochloa decumbens]|uniref:Uncharacterized protein n=1 Tax=Urochloa decumbens TaxID=240449 RepID=A0ABC9FWQ0_9POAL